MSKKHILILNSADLGSVPNKYDAIFHINDEHLHNTKSCQFKSITFSNTIYNINSYNNTLIYEYPITTPQFPQYNTIQIPHGSYNVSTFITAFNAAQSDITIADNLLTKKFAFTSIANTKILASSTLSRILGITADTAASTSYNSDQIYNFIYTYMVHVVSSDLAEPDNAITSSQKKKAVIASIPLDVGYGFVKFLDETTDTSDYSVFQGHKNLSSISLTLVDDQFRPIDMNGSDYIVLFTVLTN
jgi:hypothetical protein